ncbi:MAG: metal ABC transporter solute-binding protein, Zn/Mn family [Draconibacterium sp.]
MKNLILILSIALIFAGCGQRKATVENSSKNITVSILPQKTFIEKIAGNDFTVNVLLPPGTSPAAYSLLPSQMAGIAQTAIWFRMGYIGFELSWKDKIIAANPAMKVVDLSEGLDLIAANKSTENGETMLTGVDPHIWLSPALVKQMAAKILTEISAINPPEKEKYETNYKTFIAEIDSVDAEIRSKLAPFPGKKIITFHPSLSYFARDYGIEQLSLESGGKEPTPQRMTELIDLARRENIKVIYIQGELDREHARVFAEETGGEVVQVHPLSPDWSGNLREMTQTIISNL